MDFDAIHRMLTTAYWCKGIEREKIVRAADGSALVVGAFLEGDQVGYARVISDNTTFAWLCDVFVHEPQRGKGIASELVRFIVEHPEMQGLRRWLLATRDSHELYRPHGFNPLEAPEIWMVRGQNSPPLRD
jgi:GNAT superfamily N-acetyltransferase